ncbi:MAG: GNAT family N-acetyltransferase [Spirochaetaceae bacterium]|jgi:predicted GNAT family acetyltransferase|nr:GNAT family N-acetyltransferase [Spirochaetaceae bacterium]
MSYIPVYRWWKAHEIERIWPETILKNYEKYCVSACSRFIDMNFKKDHAWVLSTEGKTVAALLLHTQSALFPVLAGMTDIFIPPFLNRFLENAEINTLQGVEQDVILLEKILETTGLFVREARDFNLMSIEDPSQLRETAQVEGLSLRVPSFSDMDELTPLQEAYQKEEVLCKPEDFNRRLCRLELSKIISGGRALIAEMNGKIIGKINTNAIAYKHCQIGGVYVAPEYRSLGVASRLTSEFTRYLLSEKSGASLFVKKSNAAAQRVYEKCGFNKISGYRISYMYS